MRNYTDTWAVILDDNAKPLLGKIGFYEADTTELKNIYATDGVTTLQNPIYCNKVTTHQVMLCDGDYTVRYWRYIGSGNMESDQNEDSWFLYKTELIKADQSSSASGDNGLVIETISDLKDFEGMIDGQVVTVLGYYEKEDCPTREYIWHESGLYSDDGGICIKSNTQNTGAWIMKIPGTYIDVRWYGDLPDDTSDGASSNLGQRTKAAVAANNYSKDLYFPAFTDGVSNGYYMFNGSNTVSVRQNIICDDRTRFVIKEGTTGTVVSCSKLYKEGRYLFIAEQGRQIGGYKLYADWINTSWLKSVAVAEGARQGYVVDELLNPLSFSNTKIKLETSPNGCVFNNCEFVEANKVISGTVEIDNCVIKTDWFTDDYNWSQLTSLGNTILLQNCKDANTYILLKNKQNESNYGDLGEQEINATVLSGGTIENCYGTITLGRDGPYEFHNVSLTVNGIGSNMSFNAVDSWFTIPTQSVLYRLDIRRGSIAGTGALQLLSNSLLDNVNISIPLITYLTQLTVKNSDINAKIEGTEIILDHNNISATVEQIQNKDKKILVSCNYNNFKVGGKHWIHSQVPETLVEGEWVGNTCEYDDSHWIRVSRGNLVADDYKHLYSYVGNEEPYLDKFSGYNWLMKFALYKGSIHKSSDRGVFGMTALPFIWYNTNTNEFYAVNRSSIYWKMFTVGRQNTRRFGTLEMASTTYKAIGIADMDYVEHNARSAPPVLNWGVSTSVANYGCVMHATCWDAESGDANYVWSFEGPAVDHTQSEFSQGVYIGCLASNPGERWDVPSVYPDEPWAGCSLVIHLEKDIKRTNGTITQQVGWNVT